MRVNVSGTEEITRQVNVSIDPLDFLKSLKPSVCKVPSEAYIKEGEVVTSEDISHHGSPVYEYKKYNIPDLDKEILKQIISLEELLKKKMLKDSRL